MRYRIPKPDDQDKVQKAYELFLDLIKNNQKEIDPGLWLGPIIAALADNYEKSGLTFDFFKQEVIQCMDHYRYYTS